MRTWWHFGAVLLLAAAAGAGSVWGVEVTDFALYSQGNVKVKGSVQGDVGSSAGDVKLQGGTLVAGDVTAAGQVKVSPSVVVQGTITPLMQPVKGLVTAAPGMPTLPSSFAPYTFGAGGGQSFKGKYGELALDPGDYGSLKVKGTKEGGSLLLSSGEYHFDSLTAKKLDFRFDVSKGPVTIYVDGKMSLGSGLNVFVARPDGEFLSLQEAGDELAGLVYAEAGSMVKISGAEWAGTLYTPDGKLMVKKSTIDGALYSQGGIQLTSSSLAYAPLDLEGAFVWAPGGDPVPPDEGTYTPPEPVLMPEPGTFSLLASVLGGLLLLRGRRRRTS